MDVSQASYPAPAIGILLSSILRRLIERVGEWVQTCYVTGALLNSDLSHPTTYVVKLVKVLVGFSLPPDKAEPSLQHFTGRRAARNIFSSVKDSLLSEF